MGKFEWFMNNVYIPFTFVVLAAIVLVSCYGVYKTWP